MKCFHRTKILQNWEHETTKILKKKEPPDLKTKSPTELTHEMKKRSSLSAMTLKSIRSPLKPNQILRPPTGSPWVNALLSRTSPLKLLLRDLSASYKTRLSQIPLLVNDFMLLAQDLKQMSGTHMPETRCKLKPCIRKTKLLFKSGNKKSDFFYQDFTVDPKNEQK